MYQLYLIVKLVAIVNATKQREGFESGIGYDKIHNIWKGYIKNFRISDGIARWKGEDFDPNENIKVNTDLKRIFIKPFIFLFGLVFALEGLKKSLDDKLFGMYL